MTVLSGKIESLGSVNFDDKNGVPRTKHHMTISGTQIGVGLYPVKGGFGQGDEVNCETEVKFGDLQLVPNTMKRGLAAGGVSAPQPAPSSAPSRGKAFPVPKDHPDRSIIRQSSLKVATEAYIGTTTVEELASLDPEHIALGIIGLARYFEAYASGEEESGARGGIDDDMPH